MNDRFCQRRGLPIAAKLEKLLIDAANGSFTDGDLSQEIIELYSRDLDKASLSNQLKMLPQLVHTYNAGNPQTPIREVTSLRTMCDIMNSISVSRTLFNQIDRLLHIILTVPVTTSTAERSFSTLRRLKTYLRSTMTQTRLNNLMMLHIHKDQTDKLDICDIAKEFVAYNERRQKKFGKF